MYNRVKFELFLLVCGFIGSATGIIAAVFGSQELIEITRGGTAGGIILGVLLLSGMLGMIIYVINIATSHRKNWLLRLVLCISLFLVFGVVGSLY